MDFSVLSSDFRLQLEQQCDRLSSERDAIVQAAVEQATATIDASLAHINALLGNAPQSPDVKPSAKGKQKKTIEEEPEVTAIGRPEKVGKKAKASKAADTKAPKTPKQPKKSTSWLLYYFLKKIPGHELFSRAGDFFEMKPTLCFEN